MLSTNANLVQTVLCNMTVQHHTPSRTSIMLAGDVGTGKTSFVKDLSILLGMGIVIIEVPHLIEEHIINIPFVTINPRQPDITRSSAEHAELNNEYDIVLSESHLATVIKQQRKVLIPDAEYLKYIYQQRVDLISIFEEFGGSPTEIPEEFQDARAQFNCILFLDEFFRKVPVRIRNMLRTILNGHIGMDEMPKGTYVIYASNIHDDGVEGIPMNTDFFMVSMPKRTKEEYLKYHDAKYGPSKHEDWMDKLLPARKVNSASPEEPA